MRHFPLNHNSTISQGINVLISCLHMKRTVILLYHSATQHSVYQNSPPKVSLMRAWMNQVIALHSVAQIPTEPSPKWPSIRKVFHEKCCILLMQNTSLQIEILSIPNRYCSFGWCKFPYFTNLQVTCHSVDGSIRNKSHTLKPGSLYPSLYHKTQHLNNASLD